MRPSSKASEQGRQKMACCRPAPHTHLTWRPSHDVASQLSLLAYQPPPTHLVLLLLRGHLVKDIAEEIDARCRMCRRDAVKQSQDLLLAYITVGEGCPIRERRHIQRTADIA